MDLGNSPCPTRVSVTLGAQAASQASPKCHTQARAGCEPPSPSNGFASLPARTHLILLGHTAAQATTPTPPATAASPLPWDTEQSHKCPHAPPEHPKPVALPEGDGVVEGADGLDTGHRALRSKARFDEGARVEHAQKLVDYDLGKELLREQK